MSAVETSILQSASDLQIVEGHFSSIGRDSSSLTARDVYSITINNHHHTPSPNPSDSDSSSRSNPTGVSEIPVDQNVEGISPGQSGSRRSSSEAVAESTLIIQRNCDIYRYHLATQGRGLPLWIPEPSQGLPIPYQRQGISMGDVGVVTASGGFTYLFNIFRPTHHPINPPIMPDGFKPLRFIYAFDSVLSRRDLTDKGYFASPSNVQARRDRGTANFVFESSECNGAILAIPLGGKSEDLACIARLRKYVAANMTSWYRYACVCRGMEIQNGDLKVVIGCDKTSAWGMACLGSSAYPRSPSSSARGSGESRRFYLEFGPAESHSRRGGRYEWAYSGEVAEVRAGPGGMEVALLRMVSGDTDSGEGDPGDEVEYYENQCLFLRTMNATLPEEVWQQVALEEEEEESNFDEDTWKEEEDHVDPPHGYGSFGYRGSADRRSGIFGQGRPNRGGMQSESEDLSLVPSETVDNAGSSSPTSVSRSNIALDASNMASSLPSRLMSLADHPSISINSFLLSNSSLQTTMAISVDQDWMSAIREDDVTLPSSEELLRRILESHRVCENEGVVFLEPKNTDQTTVPPAFVEGETEDYDYADNIQELEPTMTEVEGLEGSNRYPPRDSRRLVRSYQRLIPPYPATPLDTDSEIAFPTLASAAPTNSAVKNSAWSAHAGHDDDEEESTVPVTLTGPQPLVYEAQTLLKQIISSKTSKSTQRVRDIPAHILPFVLVRKAHFLSAAPEGTVTLSLSSPAREITATGDRESVVQVVESIEKTIKALESALVSITMYIPRFKHHLFTGQNAELIMANSQCAVVIDQDTDRVGICGQAENLSAGLDAVMKQAIPQRIEKVTLVTPIELSKQLDNYFTGIQYTKILRASNPTVDLFLLSANSEDSALRISVFGNKPEVETVVKQISEFIGKLNGATRNVSVDRLLHRVITVKNSKKLKQFHEVHNVLVYFPKSLESSTVQLVYDPLSAGASSSPDEKKKHLDEVENELSKMARDAADVKIARIPVEKRWHDAVVGNGGKTLNAIIGEDNILSITVGADAGDSSTEDVIVLHGASSDVDRAVKEILKIVDDAQNDEIVNSHFIEFEVERQYVGRIVGSQGSGINKLRDQLGVKVDVSDDVDEKENEGGKKKKAVHYSKSKVKITGRKEHVEEAKNRILAQIERLADETSEILKIPSQYHSSLIGQSGKYAIRLEEKYSVKITFPRQSSESGEDRTREQLKPDEVLVEGRKKGVAGAKSELLEAMEFEMEMNTGNLLKFTVPTGSVARILGPGGSSINEIKDETEAQIDIDKNYDEGNSTTLITVRGTKKAIAAAKAAILAISDQVAEETIASLVVESKFHRTIIGAGGQGLKDLIAKCGGPSDPKLQAGLLIFPRQGEPSDEVRIRGDPKLVAKIKAELEQIVATLRDRVILGVDIPAAQHRALIGREGQHLNDLQSKFNVQIQFPGSRSYNQVGEPENTSELEGVEASNLVKVSGSHAACEKTLAELKANVKAPAVHATVAAADGPISTVTVPLKYHQAISQQGQFFRSLRSFGVLVDHSVMPQKSSLPVRPTPFPRIDDENVPGEPEWQVAPNYQDAEEGDSVWTLKARDQAGLDRAEQQLQEAMDNAARMSHVGFLTMPDRSTFPRIVGSKGSNVARLRDETGADITVGREDNTIVIIGSENEILSAKDAILRMVSNSGRFL